MIYNKIIFIDFFQYVENRVFALSNFIFAPKKIFQCNFWGEAPKYFVAKILSCRMSPRSTESNKSEMPKIPKALGVSNAKVSTRTSPPTHNVFRAFS